MIVGAFDVYVVYLLQGDFPAKETSKEISKKK